MLPEESQRPVRLGNTEVHDAFFEHLLDAMFLHVHLASFQGVLVLRVEARRGGHGQNVFYTPVTEDKISFRRKPNCPAVVLYKVQVGWAWWYGPVMPVTQKTKAGGL